MAISGSAGLGKSAWGALVLAPLLMLTSMGHASVALAQQYTAKDYPLVVRCSFAGTERLFYLSTVAETGEAVYLSPDRMAATITPSGTASRVMADSAGSCAGKTVDELRQSGLAFDLLSQ